VETIADDGADTVVLLDGVCGAIGQPYPKTRGALYPH
jgi:hypothetical protein